MPGQELGDKSSVAIVLLHADSEGFDSAQYKPAFKWRKNRARSFLHEGQFFRLLTRGADYCASQAVAVTVEKFGSGVDDHVRAQGDRLLEIWGHESVVNDHVYFFAMADFADCFDIAKRH